MIRYAIIFQARSGSTELAHRLHSPDQGLFNGFEIISRSGATAFNLTDREELLALGSIVKRDIVSRFFSEYSCYSHIGFKVAPYQIRDDLPGFIRHLQKTCDKLVFLYRENFVRVAVSQVWSIERSRLGHVPALRIGEENPIKKLWINPKLFSYYLIDAIVERNIICTMADLQRDSFTISHEDLYSKGRAEFERLLDYLGVSSAYKPPTVMRKILPDNVSDYIENLDEVVKVLRQYGLGGSALEGSGVAEISPALSNDESNSKYSKAQCFSLKEIQAFESLCEHLDTPVLMHEDIQEGRTEFEQILFLKNNLRDVEAKLQVKMRELEDATTQIDLIEARARHAEQYSQSLLDVLDQVKASQQGLTGHISNLLVERDNAISELNQTKTALAHAHEYNNSLLKRS